MARKMIAVVAAGAVALAPVAPAFAGTGLEDRVERLTGEGGLAGAVARVDDGRRGFTVKAGTAERGTGRPMVGSDARFRVGSMTKPVVAVTVMRLAERGKVRLGAPVETYLPGVIRGKGGVDGRKIKVRDLLRQTSGLADFTQAADWSKIPQDYLAIALAQKPTPYGRFAYSNTNYLVLGMVIDAVTGKDFRQVSRELVLEPLRMRDTYWPKRGELGIRGEHAHTYGINPVDPGAGVVDVTRLPGYEFGASGGLVSTPEDLNRFWQGVFGGRAVSAKSLRAMTADPVAVGEKGWPPQARYGYGMARVRLACGTVWMHGGGVPGVSVLSGRSATGRRATVYVTGSAEGERHEHLTDAFEAAVCR
ncbi:serine hydrolase domain-containing protein [Nonomuraea sp. NPDC048826]|uniref:serine hydrolase domain-containing protein n=1 Tax=Nonomuraea sp. NPDC048826 TaxID=3364347 RepID=UPI0037147972